MKKLGASPVTEPAHDQKGIAMQQLEILPECSFCHSQELELFYTKGTGLVVQCSECGLTARPSHEHLVSNTITLLAG